MPLGLSDCDRHPSAKMEYTAPDGMEAAETEHGFEQPAQVAPAVDAPHSPPMSLALANLVEILRYGTVDGPQIGAGVVRNLAQTEEIRSNMQVTVKP